MEDRVRMVLAGCVVLLMLVSLVIVSQVHDVGIVAMGTIVGYGVRSVFRYYFK